MTTSIVLKSAAQPAAERVPASGSPVHTAVATVFPDAIILVISNSFLIKNWITIFTKKSPMLLFYFSRILDETDWAISSHCAAGG